MLMELFNTLHTVQFSFITFFVETDYIALFVMDWTLKGV